jgi:hypothetical protein
MVGLLVPALMPLAEAPGAFFSAASPLGGRVAMSKKNVGSRPQGLADQEEKRLTRLFQKRRGEIIDRELTRFARFLMHTTSRAGLAVMTYDDVNKMLEAFFVVQRVEDKGKRS